MGDSVLSVSSRALLEACARLGLDTEQILRAARLERATIQDPDARIPFEQVGALWLKAHELSGDPNLALHAVEVLPIGAYRVIDFLAAAAPTIGAALAKVSDYFPIINAAARLEYVVGDRQVTYAFEAPSLPPAVAPHYAEYTLAAIFVRGRIATQQPFRLMRVELSRPRPDDVREHERVFDCPVRFGAATSQMILAREVWDTPSAASNPGLLTVLETHARRQLEQLTSPDDLVRRVRGAIAMELQGGHPKLQTIARRLAMSARTLQRRLRDEGVVFNDVLDELRFSAAKSYLAQEDIAAAEVAYLLGFAEQSSFNRAFKRWSGQTPTEYRRRDPAV